MHNQRGWTFFIDAVVRIVLLIFHTFAGHDQYPHFKMKNRGVIAAGDRLTAEAGAEILRAGGNAFDAAIAATFMSFAASSSITSAGGGGFLLAHHHHGENVLYDFFVQTPKVKRPVDEIEFFPVTVDFGDKTQEFHIGFGSVATPGNIAGLFEVHRDLGSMPMKEVMIPVLERIRRGIVLHRQTKYQIHILRPILSHTPHGKGIYFKNDKTPEVGDTYSLPQMADFFGYLSLEGPRDFYEGEIAAKVAELSRAHGGHITRNDFSAYRVMKRKPFSIRYRDAKVITNPPPNAGGPLIAFLLKIIEGISLQREDYGSAKHLQAVAEAIRLTTAARLERYENRMYEQGILNKLFEPSFVATMRKALLSSMHKSGNTTHVSVMDGAGNIASCTTSVGEGCGYLIPGTDVMLNNMLGEEDLNKDGFHKWREDTRMSSMMSPTVVLRQDGEMAGMGSGGSNRIRSAISQAIINYIDFGLPYDNIVNDSRIHLEGTHLDIEPGFSHDEVEKVRLPDGVEKFFWNEQNMYFGGVHAVFHDRNGGLHGAGDHRRAGHVIKID